MKFAFLALALLGQFRQELPEPKQVTPPASKAQDAPKGAGGSQASDNQRRLSSEKQPKTVVTPKAVDNRPVILYWSEKDGSCTPCNKFHAWKDSPAGKDFPAQFQEFEKMPEGAQDGIPYFEHWRIEGKKKTKWTLTGFCCPYHMEKAFRKLLGHASAARWKGVDADFDNMDDHRVAAKPARLPFRNQVRQAFGVLKQARIGKFSAALHSNDGKRSVRVLGSNQTAISILAVCGGSGSFVLDAPGSLIPDGRLEFGYRMSGPNRGKLMFELPFDFDAPKAAACKEACGFGPLEILSAVTMVMRLLNSSAEVALPADIAFTGAFTGTSIAAEFLKGQSPLVVINFGWTWERRFIGAEATEAGATVFSTVPFNKRKRIEFN